MSLWQFRGGRISPAVGTRERTISPGATEFEGLSAVAPSVMLLALASSVFFRKTLICTSQFEARSRSHSWWGFRRSGPSHLLPSRSC